MTSGPRVIKLGGSLLAWPEWVEAFDRWIAQQPPAANVVIVGGGAVVEALRQIDRAHALPAETAHWLAVRAMSLTAALAARLLPRAELIVSLERLPPSASHGLWVLDVEGFLRADARGADQLPCSWDATSDSIAARVAVRLGANELVLLKSALPSEGCDALEELARAGYVDAYFARAARGLRVRVVNLRDDGHAELAIE